MGRLIVLEVNELPLRVLEWWVDREPTSCLAGLVDHGSVTETVLDEDLPRDLYPSQSWASIGTGVRYADHGVFWYGDPKPRSFPFYWQAAADAGKSVGLLGVLHTSPRRAQAAGESYRFVVPDVFGDDASTFPDDLQPLHELNLRLSRQSARVASLRLGAADARGALSLARHGVRPSTWAAVATIAGNVASRRWNKERLRVAQSLLMADVFLHSVERHDPDLSVVFLNHVAAFMHRYWAATFPEDWPGGSGYTPEWVDQHRGELAFAMGALDRVVAGVEQLAGRTDRTLLLVSSMGQQADRTVDPSEREQAVVRSPEVLLAEAGVTPPFEIRPAMVPQFTVVVGGQERATAIISTLTDFLGPTRCSTMTAVEGSKWAITVAYRPECRGSDVLVGGRWRTAADVGMSVESVTDHRSGRHSPRGVLVSNRSEPWPAEIDAFDFAPMVLERLGVPALDHHRTVTPA